MLRKIIFLVIIIGVGVFLYNKITKATDLFGPVEKETSTVHQVVVEKIEAMGKLELVKYNLKDVVEHKEIHDRFIPDSKVVLIVSGEAVGCIDLTKIDSSSVRVSNDSVWVRLPQPEICYYKIDHENSKVVGVENTFFKSDKLVDAAYKEAEKQIMRSALQMQILEQTKDNAQKMLKPMLEAISGRKVILTYELPKEQLKVNRQ